MPQPMPVIRKLYWPGLIPQFLAIAVLCAVAWFVLPSANCGIAIFAGAGIYLIFCRLMRWFLVRDHMRGMQAYRAADNIGGFMLKLYMIAKVIFHSSVGMGFQSPVAGR